jgi:CRP-like cAMP-binding protein
VKVSRSAPRNRRHILYLSGPGEVLGLESVLTGEPHSSTAEMAEDGTVCLIDRGEIQAILQERTEVARAIAETMAQQLLRCEDERVELAGGDVRERLAATLLNLATRFGEPEDEAMKIALQLSREELAEMIGASTETTIRQLSEFREQGIVSNSGRRIRLDDPERLARIARVTNGQGR